MKKSIFNKIISALAIWGAICLILLIFHIVTTLLKPSREHLEFWHEKTRTVFSDLELGLTKAEVAQIAKRQTWPEEMIDVRDTRICLWTPMEFLAGNWVIFLDFNGDKLVSAKVRTSSNPNAQIWPLEAPPDLIQENQEKKNKM